MPRRGNVAKRDVLPDPMYNSKLVTRLINNIMYVRSPGRRDHRRYQQRWRRCQEARRYPQDGRSQQGFRTLQMVIYL